MDYLFIRHLHITCAAISIALFALRWLEAQCIEVDPA